MKCGDSKQAVFRQGIRKVKQKEEMVHGNYAGEAGSGGYAEAAP